MDAIGIIVGHTIASLLAGVVGWAYDDMFEGFFAVWFFFGPIAYAVLV